MGGDERERVTHSTHLYAVSFGFCFFLARNCAAHNAVNELRGPKQAEAKVEHSLLSTASHRHGHEGYRIRGDNVR